MFNGPRTRILVADDHEVIRFGLKILLPRHGFEFMGTAANGHEAIDLVRRLRPDVVIMDICMPSCGGLEATGRLRKEAPDSRILAFSFRPGASVVLSVLKAGALGYVCKSSSHSVLVDAISVVAKGKRFLDPSLADATLGKLLEDEPIASSSLLTPREREVLIRVAWGFTNGDIGAELCLSKKTVEGYRARASEKLDLHDRPAIVKYAVMAGWMDEQAG
jgi:two-component system response regulator NreC